MKKKSNINILWTVTGLIVLFYLLTHLVSLISLPVFADESIYIRWTQLIIDDWQRYLFFPLNDGKTPLFIWLLLPFQFIFKNQLFAGRILAVIIGLIQMFIVKKIIKVWGLKKRYQYLGMLLVCCLPFWYFHHRMALMDGLLTLWTSLTILFTYLLIDNFKNKKIALKLILFNGLAFGAGLLTKLPMLLLAPSLFLPIIFSFKKIKIASKLKLMTYQGFSLLIGGGMFVALKLHPAFSQLFTRGGDFLYPWQEIIFDQAWQQTIGNIPTYLNYFVQYLTWPILLLSILSLFSKHKKISLALHLSWLGYALPIFIMGRVVYPRYLFPVSIFITLAAILGVKTLLNRQKICKLIVGCLLLVSGLMSSGFIYYSLTNYNKTPFVSADIVQYLTEWSAGYGVKETVELIQTLTFNHSVLVLSEGFFGTLPDGLLMYLHRRDVTNLYITGIGQPIYGFSPEMFSLAPEYDQILLVGNSHRLQLNLEEAELLLESCRPLNAPCHQVWDITKLVQMN
jgi:4-amino-4-deoxy-L-arabinose transferase-like glycosyltransferase